MKASGYLWNGLTVVMLGMTFLTCAWVAAVFMNPQGPFNPLRPQGASVQNATDEPSAPLGTPTEAIEFPTLPPEWTATFTPQGSPRTPTQTSTLAPTATDTPEPSATVPLSPVGPTPTITDTPTPTATSTVRAPTATQPSGGYPPAATATPGSGYP